MDGPEGSVRDKIPLLAPAAYVGVAASVTMRA